VNTLVTDRHPQIQKWLRENQPTTRHLFDVWHVAKGLKKKLEALSKEKDCGEVKAWIKSITNHLYWSAASTPDQNGDVIVAKWKSVCQPRAEHPRRPPGCPLSLVWTRQPRRQSQRQEMAQTRYSDYIYNCTTYILKPCGQKVDLVLMKSNQFFFFRYLVYFFY
jgi:hypothetical protein